MILLAAIFLAAAWIWDALVAFGRWFLGLVPWLALRARMIAWINRLPIFLVVLIYGVPFLVVEPLKGVLLWLMATGHFMLGLISLIFLQTFGLSFLALVFDLTRERLLTLRWFAWAYGKALLFHHFADQLIAPYKEAVKREWRAFRQWVGDRRARLAAASNQFSRSAPTDIRPFGDKKSAQNQ
jgi:hypothetical protein